MIAGLALKMSILPPCGAVNVAPTRTVSVPEALSDPRRETQIFPLFVDQIVKVFTARPPGVAVALDTVTVP